MQVRQAVGNKTGTYASSIGSALRGVGRMAIWSLVGLLLIRGVLGVTSTAPQSAAPVEATAGESQASESLAIRFARTYLADPSSRALLPFLAEGTKVGTGRSPLDGTSVAQAEVSDTEEFGDGETVLTVACELRDARTLYLAVPIVRSGAGEVAVLGAPSIVAAPGVAGAGSDRRSRPLAGPQASSIRALVVKFMPAYLAATQASELSYLVEPGVSIRPLAGAMELLSLSAVTQLGSGEGPRRSVLVAVRVGDPRSRAAYPLVYRLDLVRGARWYVEAIQGAPA